MINEYKMWDNNLPLKINKESQQIESWCLSRDFDVYKRYTKNGYFEKINNALRYGYTNDFFVQEDIQALDRLFQKMPTQIIPKTDMTVYRGTFLTNELSDILQGKSKTNIFTDKAFVSTSKSKQVAKQFVNNEDKILLKITVPKGSKVIDDERLPSYVASIMKGEQEVLLPRNARFKVLSYDENSGIVDVLYLGQKQPLEMPEFFEHSGQDILSDLNKNSLLIEKIPLYNKELKNKI